MNPFLERLRTALARLSTGQKVRLAAALVATLGLVWGFTLYANRVRYGVLFSNLEREDAAPVMTVLRERNVPYRLAAGGTMIEVPFSRVDELRLELAGEGLPRGGGVGFELFDKPTFGLSDFVQNVNYRRALERELGRTIQSLDGVESARVHVALPAETVFADEHRRPSASVVVRLRSGRTLSRDRVRAVQYMVASGVEGLEPADVSVIDGEGRMLSTVGDEDPQMLTATQLETKQSMERGIESTLLALLEPLAGAGKVKARATVDLKMTRVERVEESYDPAGAVVRSEQRSKSRNDTGQSQTGGVPGTASNVPGSAPSAGGASTGSQESQTSTTNFEINKTIATISEPVGVLARQSVAVVLDNATPAAPADGAQTPATPTPRSPEEMRKITELVRAAIGFDEERGDQLIVQNVPFEDAVPALDAGGGGSLFDSLHVVLRYVSLPLAVLLLALLVIRPALSALRGAATAEGGTTAALPPTVAQLQARIASGDLPALADGGSSLRRKLIEAVGEDPQAAALVVRNWIERPHQTQRKG